MSNQARRFSLQGLLALLLLLSTLLAIGVAGAATEAQNATPIDVFCVTGSVIDHAEQPSGGWIITASDQGDITKDTSIATSTGVISTTDSSSTVR